uniref:Uncharacterized protein n=1 Tax=Rhizophora mucronata TaxID=61149 RepID=A0A2P2NQ31_RHIMU
MGKPSITSSWTFKGTFDSPSEGRYCCSSSCKLGLKPESQRYRVCYARSQRISSYFFLVNVSFVFFWHRKYQLQSTT